MTNGTTRSLERCAPGEGGSILGIREGGKLRQRLLEMGLVRGTHVEVLRTAPLGDPVEVKLRSYLLTLRKSEAAAVILQVQG